MIRTRQLTSQAERKSTPRILMEVHRLLTQFEVRQRVLDIRRSEVSPQMKARELLRLGKSLRHQARAIRLSQQLSLSAKDRKGAATLERMARTASMLHEELRSEALAALRTDFWAGAL